MAGEAVGRLAMRVEGDLWNAYYAQQGTMEGALLLGSIRLGAVATNKVRKEAFMNLMMDLVSEVIKDITGADLDWNQPQRAPEHERGGRA